MNDIFVWKRGVHLVNYTCFSWALVKFCVCPSFLFGIQDGMWDVTALVPDYCVSVYFKPAQEKCG